MLILEEASIQSGFGTDMKFMGTLSDVTIGKHKFMYFT